MTIKATLSSSAYLGPEMAPPVRPHSCTPIILETMGIVITGTVARSTVYFNLRGPPP
ncbi:hypothetical protein CDL15_Pgr015361 [Punica granatum]|uniref:Uncharacterized protein n=1 Tax=Punica granatum TaxID=22663 RepID=A0A218VZU9_PUNGR|nr:hypothetical protein CDL15_Pgr015361 [Punica granatum]